ncbi:tail tube protein [Vibrio phage vB_VcorM_GR28A]|nr:tail tube protein [Vibrio phage vB_VcorM_GR28A]
MRVSTFQAALNRHGGVQRQYRWRWIPNLPAAIASPSDLEDVSLMAISTTLPPSTLGEVLIPWGGRELPLPGDRKFQPWTVTMINTTDDFAHALCENWSELINGTQSNVTTGDQTALLLDQTLQLLDENDNVVREYTLELAWPQEVGEVELDQQSQDSFGQFTLTLRYLQHSHDRTL